TAAHHRCVATGGVAAKSGSIITTAAHCCTWAAGGVARAAAHRRKQAAGGVALAAADRCEIGAGVVERATADEGVVSAAWNIVAETAAHYRRVAQSKVAAANASIITPATDERSDTAGEIVISAAHCRVATVGGVLRAAA